MIRVNKYFLPSSPPQIPLALYKNISGEGEFLLTGTFMRRHPVYPLIQ
jgi:hypothetical protein